MNLQSLFNTTKLKTQLQNPKRRLQYFLISLVLIYFVWAFLLINPINSSKKEVETKIATLQLQITEVRQKLSSLNESLQNKDIDIAITKKKQIELKINELDKEITKSHLLFVTGDDWIKFKKEIVDQQLNIDKNITLISIVDYSIQPWIPPAKDKTDPTKLAPEAIYQHQLELRFQADYFSAINYLSRLEKLALKVYWDSLNYTVLVYPKAEIAIKFHIFTHEKNEA